MAVPNDPWLPFAPLGPSSGPSVCFFTIAHDAIVTPARVLRQLQLLIIIESMFMNLEKTKDQAESVKS